MTVTLALTELSPRAWKSSECLACGISVKSYNSFKERVVCVHHLNIEKTEAEGGYVTGLELYSVEGQSQALHPDMLLPCPVILILVTRGLIPHLP